MKNNKISSTLLGLSVAGLLFSGYLSGVKFFTETCAFNESCPYFWGYPACYFGFVMFLLLTVFSYLLVFSDARRRRNILAVSIVSFLGILFAGYFTLLEIPILFTDGLRAYALGLPTCALGLVFFLLIFIYSTFIINRQSRL